MPQRRLRCVATRLGPPRKFTSVQRLVVTGSNHSGDVERESTPPSTLASFLESLRFCCRKQQPASVGPCKGGFTNKMLFSAVASCPLAAPILRIADQSSRSQTSRAACAVLACSQRTEPDRSRGAGKCVQGGAAGVWARSHVEAGDRAGSKRCDTARHKEASSSTEALGPAPLQGGD